MNYSKKGVYTSITGSCYFGNEGANLKKGEDTIQLITAGGILVSPAAILYAVHENISIAVLKGSFSPHTIKSAIKLLEKNRLIYREGEIIGITDEYANDVGVIAEKIKKYVDQKTIDLKNLTNLKALKSLDIINNVNPDVELDDFSFEAGKIYFRREGNKDNVVLYGYGSDNSVILSVLLATRHSDMTRNKGRFKNLDNNAKLEKAVISFFYKYGQSSLNGNPIELDGEKKEIVRSIVKAVPDLQKQYNSVMKEISYVLG